jgi:hypothetical protein
MSDQRFLITTSNGTISENRSGVTLNDDTNFKNDNLKPLQQQPKPQHITHAPPDGGTRAWLVMAGAFLCNGILFGIINVYSVFYLSLQQHLTDSGDLQASSKAGKHKIADHRVASK